MRAMAGAGGGGDAEGVGAADSIGEVLEGLQELSMADVLLGGSVGRPVGEEDGLDAGSKELSVVLGLRRWGG